MRRFALITFLLLILLASTMQVWHVSAPEHFDQGQFYALRYGERWLGLINGWGWYALYGTAHDCRIIPIASPLSDAGSVACHMRFNAKNNAFSGWIVFRGHPRPFCGALRADNLPRTCFGE